MKKFVCIIFALLMAATVIVFAGLYKQEADRTSQNDLFGKSFDLWLVASFSVMVYIAEIEITHDILYFLSGSEKKDKSRTIFNGVALCLAGFFFAAVLLIGIGEMKLFSFLSWDIVSLAILLSAISFGLYALWRVSCCVVSLITKLQRGIVKRE